MAAVVSAGNLTHLTWWAVTLLLAVDVGLVVNPDSAATRRVWVASASLSLLVQFVVMLMSALRCSMIREALGEVGPWVYYFGNFALHYWPTLRLVACRPVLPEVEAGLYLDAARILAIYSTLFRPEEVYACSGVPTLMVLPLGVLAATASEWIVVNVLTQRPMPAFRWPRSIARFLHPALTGGGDKSRRPPAGRGR